MTCLGEVTAKLDGFITLTMLKGRSGQISSSFLSSFICERVAHMATLFEVDLQIFSLVKKCFRGSDDYKLISCRS